MSQSYSQFNSFYIFRNIVFICSSLFILSGCTHLFFYPQKQLVRTPADIGVQYQEVNFTSSDGEKLNGWFLPANRQALGTVLFFHGNAENISTHLSAVYWLPKEGFNVFLFDYRGYGKSEGKTDIQGIHLDAAAALQYLRIRPDINPEKIVLFGQSLGAAVALYTAATQNQLGIKAVILESGFSDYRLIFREKLSAIALTWPLQWPLSYTVENAYSPLNFIGDIAEIPLLLIHGDNDATVPHQHSLRLFEAAQGDKQLWIIEGGGHSQTFSRFGNIYRSRLVEYLTEHLML